MAEHLMPEIRIQIRQVTQDPAVAIQSPCKNKSNIFLMRIKDSATLVWKCTTVYTHCDYGYGLQQKSHRQHQFLNFEQTKKSQNKGFFSAPELLTQPVIHN